MPAEETRKKTAVVTGGASGLGAVMAQHFAREGYNVAILDVNAAMGEQVLAAAASPSTQQKTTGAVVFRTCDVSSWADQADNFRAVYHEFGRIDVVCANAGISEGGASALAQVETEEPAEPNLKVLDVNLTGVIYCKSCPVVKVYGHGMKPANGDFFLLIFCVAVKLAIHYMNKNDPSESSRGNIICTASNAGLYAFPVSPLYAASKAGVIGLVRSTAPILAQQKIRINALAPAVLGA